MQTLENLAAASGRMAMNDDTRVGIRRRYRIKAGSSDRHPAASAHRFSRATAALAMNPISNKIQSNKTLLPAS